MNESIKTWNWKKLIICHILIAFLLITFFWPSTRTYWESLDIAFFRLINETLRDSTFLQNFWALANHKKADWLEDICIFAFFYSWIRSRPKSERPLRAAEFIFCILYSAMVILLVNHLVFRQLVEVFRASPSIALEDTIRLSKKLRWLSIKDSSPKCFPADHGTTAILFAALHGFFTNRKRAVLGWLYAAFLCMPRMITGAHWLSDIIVGSGSIVLFFLSWGLFTPIRYYAVNGLQKILFSFRKKQPV